jgi:3-phenylpropionate/trans-cinnamate dioxygenase ferredoxin reductase component
VLTDDGEPVPYDALVLATGAEAAVLPIEGADHPEVLRLRRVEDALRLRERAEPGRRAVVVGSGFIGCEAAASLAMRGLAVTLVSDEPVPHEARLGADAGGRIAGWLTELGVELRLGTGVELIADGHRVHLPGSAPLEADLVLVGGGITPNAQLAEAAGLPLERGRVVVDEHMRSGRHGILAAGDVAFAHNAAAGRPLAVEHWGEALNMGETAGRVAAGEDASWAVAPGFWSTIGPHVLKYAAWGDGHDEARLEDHGGPFTVWYGRGGITVGVLAHERDEDYERGRELVETGAPLP